MCGTQFGVLEIRIQTEAGCPTRKGRGVGSQVESANVSQNLKVCSGSRILNIQHIVGGKKGFNFISPILLTSFFLSLYYRIMWISTFLSIFALQGGLGNGGGGSLALSLRRP